MTDKPDRDAMAKERLSTISDADLEALNTRLQTFQQHVLKMAVLKQMMTSAQTKSKDAPDQLITYVATQFIQGALMLAQLCPDTDLDGLVMERALAALALRLPELGASFLMTGGLQLSRGEKPRPVDPMTEVQPEEQKTDPLGLPTMH